MERKIGKNGLLVVFPLVVLMSIGSFGLNSWDEKCSISKGSGFTVDSCDASKFLTCQNGRCACDDASTQIYTYRLERYKRQKRGIGKNVAIGAGGAFFGYQLGKATSNNGGPQQSSPNWGTSGLYRNTVYACYGRVGAPCALYYNNVRKDKKSVNTTAEIKNRNGTVNESSSDGISSFTTTTETPITVDLQKLSKCVYRAVCTPSNSVNNLSREILKTNDPRVGVCSCDNGSRRTSKDLCESGANIPQPTLFAMLLYIYYCACHIHL